MFWKVIVIRGNKAAEVKYSIERYLAFYTAVYALNIACKYAARRYEEEIIPRVNDLLKRSEQLLKEAERTAGIFTTDR